MTTTLWRHARLATLAGASGWGWIDNGALLADGPTLQWVGDAKALKQLVDVDPTRAAACRINISNRFG